MSELNLGFVKDPEALNYYQTSASTNSDPEDPGDDGNGNDDTSESDLDQEGAPKDAAPATNAQVSPGYGSILDGMLQTWEMPADTIALPTVHVIAYPDPIDANSPSVGAVVSSFQALATNIAYGIGHVSVGASLTAALSVAPNPYASLVGRLFTASTALSEGIYGFGLGMATGQSPARAAAESVTSVALGIAVTGALVGVLGLTAPLSVAATVSVGIAAGALASLAAPQVVDLFGIKPIILDLDGNGLSGKHMLFNSITMDVDMDGYTEAMQWAPIGDGVLVRDINQDRRIDNINEISFAQYAPPGGTDLDGLRIFDVNQNGIFEEFEAELANIKVWADENGNGITEFGELKSLFDAGVMGIHLQSHGPQEDWGNVVVHGQTTFYDGAGNTKTALDVELRYDPNGATYQMLPNGTTLMVDEMGRKALAVFTRDSVTAYAESEQASQIIGGANHDYLYARPNHSTFLYGGDGNDFLTGGTQNDFLMGGPGSDHIWGGPGNDTIFADLLDITQGLVDGGEGYDVLYLSEALPERITLKNYNFESAIGNDGDDSISAYGNSVGATLVGAGGNDFLTGSEYNDVFDPGAGSNQIEGWGGFDTIMLVDKYRSVSTVSVDSTGVHGVVSYSDGSALFGFMERIVFADGALDLDKGSDAWKIYRLYEALGGAPDMPGLQYWTDRALDEDVNQTLATALINGTGLSGVDNHEFVSQLYVRAFSRTGSGEDVNYWKWRLDTGDTREFVAKEFAESGEMRNLLHSQGVHGVFVTDEDTATVAKMYNTFLDRRPDQAGLLQHSFTAKSKGSESAAQEIVDSQEFQNLAQAGAHQVFMNAYQAGTGRHASQSEISHWVSFASNEGWAKALTHFVDSLEVNNHLTADVYGSNGVWLG